MPNEKIYNNERKHLYQVNAVFVDPQVFQCLIIDGENCGDDALRQAETFVISDKEFRGFLDRHKNIKCLVPESNQQVFYLNITNMIILHNHRTELELIRFENKL